MNIFMNIYLLNRFNKCEYVSSILTNVQFTRSLWSQVQSFNEYIHKELIHEEYSYELNHPMNIVKMDIVNEFFHSLNTMGQVMPGIQGLHQNQSS